MVVNFDETCKQFQYIKLYLENDFDFGSILSNINTQWFFLYNKFAHNASNIDCSNWDQTFNSSCIIAIDVQKKINSTSMKFYYMIITWTYFFIDSHVSVWNVHIEN